MAKTLSGLGVQQSEISELKAALDHDAKDDTTTTPGLGSRTAGWLKDFGKKSGNLALSVGIEVAKKEAIRLILGYLGM